MSSSFVKTKDMAAAAMSRILQQHSIQHAYIGGYAVTTLGHMRNTLDIDVEVDVENKVEALRTMVQLLIQADGRFSLDNNKLIFTNGPHRVPIETLPVGELGLPRKIETIQAGEEMVPVMRPTILILTKIKRCVQYISSTRPKSILKFQSDLSDIVFLLQWLKVQGQTIDFDGYDTTPDKRERLYTAVKELVGHWQQVGFGERIENLKAVLSMRDRVALDI